MENTFRINENLLVDSKFKEFLIAHPFNRVVSVLLGFRTLKEVNYIAVTDKVDTVSYLPYSKVEYVEANGIDPYSNGIGRTYIKVGRLVSKLFPKNLINEYISHSHVEEFVNSYKSFFDESRIKMVVVSGQDIKKYYLDRNYLLPDVGTLWKSCMRYKDRQPFLELYAVNPDKIKMLVLLINQDGVEKVKGRAILWEDVEDSKGHKLKVMDRIYTVFDSDVYIFKRWARENGYISKYFQNAKSQNVLDINGAETYVNLSISLDNHLLEYYPYLDSFQFYDSKSGKFYNNTSKYYDYTLIQANGNPYPPEPEDSNDDTFEDGFLDFDED